MAAKIVHQMKEKMLLAGQGARLAEMIPKREGALTLPSITPLKLQTQVQAPIPPTSGKETTASDNLATSNLHLPLALRKQRRPNAGFKPQPRQEIKKKKKRANTVLQLKEELRQQLEKKREAVAAAAAAAEAKAKPTVKSAQKKKLKRLHSGHVESYHKKRKIRPLLRDGKTNNDYYCWVCHQEQIQFRCQACPRVYHRGCIPDYSCDPTMWFCPDCDKITTAECIDTQSVSLASLSDDDLAGLLQCALTRMKHTMSGPFVFPVSMETAPNYLSYIFNPMDLTTLEKNIKNHVYGSPEAFLADVKWITHNCIIYNGTSSKMTRSAELIAEIAEHEIQEIQICPDCYTWSSSKKKNWFCEPCRMVHTLVWAKLKGFPYWPAKVLREDDNRLDVRFFGQHDRAWVQVQDCYRISKEMPFPPTNNKTNGLNHAFREVEIHMKKLRDRRIKCEYSPIRTPYDPSRIYANRKLVPGPVISRPTPSKGRKRKRKGTVAHVVKKTFVPVLRDLEPLSYDSDEAEDPGKRKVGKLGDNQAEVKKEEVESEQAEEQANKKVATIPGSEETKESEKVGGSDNQTPSQDMQKVPADGSSLTSPNGDKDSGTPKGDTPTSRFNVSRKVYSRSGKFLSLASNITEDARSVVDWVPSEEESTETGGEEARKLPSKDDVKVPKDTSELGKKVDGSGEKTPGGVSIMSKENSVDGSTPKEESVEASEHSEIVGENTPAAVDKISATTTTKSATTPVVLPNKLPDLQTILVKSENIPAPLASSEGTQVTPQKNDKFNEKLNQTINSCRKFLGLESESTERQQDTGDDESLAKSDLDSELDSSQDESESESAPSRQVTPLSMMEEGASPRSGRSSRKPSVDFSDSDSDENENAELKLVIDGEIQKSEAEKGKSERPGEPLASPKLMIKLPFGQKGKQRTATDAESSLAEDDDDFDGDKEMQDIETRAVEEIPETDEEVRDPVVDMETTSSSDVKDTNQEPKICAEVKVVEVVSGKADGGKEQEGGVKSKDGEREQLNSSEVILKETVPGASKEREKDVDKGHNMKMETGSGHESLAKDESEEIDSKDKNQNESTRKEGEQLHLEQDPSKGHNKQEGRPQDGNVSVAERTDDETSDKIIKMETDASSGCLQGGEVKQIISNAEVTKTNNGNVKPTAEKPRATTDDGKQLELSSELEQNRQSNEIAGSGESEVRQGTVQEMEVAPSDGGTGESSSGVETGNQVCRGEAVAEEPESANMELERSCKPEDAGVGEKTDMLGHTKDDDETSIVRRTLDDIVRMVDKDGEGSIQPGNVDRTVKSETPECSKDEEMLVIKKTLENIVGVVEKDMGMGVVTTGEEDASVVRKTLDDIVGAVEKDTSIGTVPAVADDDTVVRKALNDIVGVVEKDMSIGAVPAVGEDSTVVRKTIEDIVGKVEKDVNRSDRGVEPMSVVCDRKDSILGTPEVTKTHEVSTADAKGTAGPEKVTRADAGGSPKDEDEVIGKELGGTGGAQAGSDVTVDIVHPERVQFETIIVEEMDVSEGETKKGGDSEVDEYGSSKGMQTQSVLVGKTATINGEEVTIIDDVDDMEVEVQPKVTDALVQRAETSPSQGVPKAPDDEPLVVEDMDVTESVQSETGKPPAGQGRGLKEEGEDEEVICLDESSTKRGDDVDPVVRDVLLSICRKIEEAVSNMGTVRRTDASRDSPHRTSPPPSFPGASSSGDGKQQGESSAAGHQVAVLEGEPSQLPTDSPASLSLSPGKFGGSLLSMKEKRIARLEEELRQMRKKWMIEKQEGIERKSTYELMVLEIFENYQIILEDKIAKMAKEHETELLDVKRKQWCAYCQKEAVFFCCWNTSYCDYPCQQKHWALHQRVCQQATKNAAATAAAPQTSGPMATNPPQQTGPGIPVCQPGPQGSSNLTNLIQYVRYMPGNNSDLHNVRMRSPTMVPIQMPSTSTMGLGPTSGPQMQRMNSTLVTGAHMQPAQIPGQQLPGQQLPGQQMQTGGHSQQLMAHQLHPMGQALPMGPPAQMGPYQQNLQPPQQQFNFQSAASMGRQQMPNGNEVLLHIPPGIRMPSMLANPNM